MGFNLKKLIKSGWKSLILPISPLFLYTAWQTGDWLVKGGSWLDAMISLQGVLPLLLSAIIFFLLLVHYSKDIQERLGGLDKLSRKLNEVQEQGIEALSGAASFMRRAFGLKVDTRILEEHPEDLFKALQAVGFNLCNWEVQLYSDYPNSILKSKEMRSVWLQYLRTYFFEEAFDIRRKEIVTNGRNYPFLILSTVQAYIDNLPSDKVLYYYAVTPAHPKDMYNWPHGHIKPRAYFEEEFMGSFHRLLRETLLWYSSDSKIVHGRFVLASNTYESIDMQPFGWRLDHAESMKKHLLNSWMLPVAVPLEKLPLARYDMVGAIGKYYTGLNEVFPARRDDKKESRLIVPLFCNSWQSQEIIKRLSQLAASAFQSAFDILQGIPDREAGLWLKQTAQSHHQEAVENALCESAPDKGWLGCAAVFTRINDKARNLLDGHKVNILEFIQECHHYDALLSERDAIPRQNALARLRASMLRFLDAKSISAEWLINWPSLGEVFAKHWHSGPGNCWIVELTKKEASTWFKDDVAPEFAIFGTATKSNLPDLTKNIEWQLVLATDLDYPFDVAKIRFLEPTDKDDNLRLWNYYVAKIEGLRGNGFKKSQVYQGNKEA